MSAQNTSRSATKASRQRPLGYAPPTADAISSLPSELVAALVAEGERSAARVAEFLRRLGISASPTTPVALPPELLVGLNVALRFRAWELNCITAHTDAGLPSSDQVIERVMSLLVGDELQAYVMDLDLKAISILREQFVWQAGCVLGADIVIKTGDNEEAFLDAMADFLWAHRDKLEPLENEP